MSASTRNMFGLQFWSTWVMVSFGFLHLRHFLSLLIVSWVSINGKAIASGSVYETPFKWSDQATVYLFVSLCFGRQLFAEQIADFLFKPFDMVCFTYHVV